MVSKSKFWGYLLYQFYLTTNLLTQLMKSSTCTTTTIYLSVACVQVTSLKTRRQLLMNIFKCIKKNCFYLSLCQMQIRKKISILLQENHLIIITPLLQAPANDCTNYEIFFIDIFAMRSYIVNCRPLQNFILKMD